ncbi:MAG: SUF system NifU family Fe-S cluster assembly protein [Calditrichia bacterium]
MDFNDLYQEIILDHYKSPRNFGEGKPYCTSVELDNPVCGDHIKLTIEVNDEGIIEDAKFSGSGCAISVASASMMTEAIKGKSLEKVKQIIAEVLGVMRGEQDSEILEEYGDIFALKGVKKYPVRVKCATLSWHAAQQVIEKLNEK